MNLGIIGRSVRLASAGRRSRAATGAVLAVILSAAVAGGPGHVPQRVHEMPDSGYAPRDKVVALTFDDGPDPLWTSLILDILAERDVRATFFVIGWRAEAFPQSIDRIVGAGHGLGGHTWTHRDLRGLSESEFSEQVDRTRALLPAGASGRNRPCVRPPYGSYDKVVVSWLAARELEAVTWSLDPRDWSNPGAPAIVSAVLGRLHPGAVILLHDGEGRAQTVEALPAIIDGIRARGYELVPICIG